MENTEVKNNKKGGKVLKGTVVSNKMQSTIIVRVDRYVKHPKYKKYINKSKKYQVDSREGNISVGDKVSIIETRPISKNKHFKVLKKISRGLSKKEE